MPMRLLLRMKVRKIVFLLVMVLTFFPISTYALPTRVYLNETALVNIDDNSNNYTLSTNLTINESINLTFEAKASGIGDFEVELTAANNKSSYLLRIFFDNEAESETIKIVDCANASIRNLFYNDGVIGIELGIFNVISIVVNSFGTTANISIGDTSIGLMETCKNVSEIGQLSFINTVEQSGSVEVKNISIIANNKNPAFIGNIPNHAGLPNQTWPENTSIGFNISGNFSDANNDTLTFSLEAAVENITINVNLTSGIVNLTPNPDFFGVRYARFIANDSDNITFSNNVTLNVTNVNDLPIITSVAIANADDLNRTNGSLTASWTFDDKDQDIISANETLWYINGIENASLRNSTNIGSQNTTKSQNWSFSVRINDGAGFSNFAYSANLTIENALQEFSHALGVETVERGKLFTYDVNYTDLDNDNITFSDNSTLFNITSEGIINFTPTAYGNMTINITLSQNPNVSNILTIEVSDTLAPEITSIIASSSGTTTVTVTLSATTDETAQCRFATSDLNFTNMSTMSSTNSVSHSNSQSFTSDTSGIYYVRCNDTIGNAMNFSNSTAFNADAQESSGDSSSASSGGGGGGGGGGWQCRYAVQCTVWSECADGEQTRECSNVEVTPFYSLTKCEYLLEQETERECTAEEACSDNIRNQGEEGVDCGGPCGPCFTISTKIDNNETKSDEINGQTPTGAVIFSDLMGNIKPGHGLIALAIIAALGILSFKHFRRPPSELTQEEMKKLYGTIEDEHMKSKEEQDRVN